MPYILGSWQDIVHLRVQDINGRLAAGEYSNPEQLATDLESLATELKARSNTTEAPNWGETVDWFFRLNNLLADMAIARLSSLNGQVYTELHQELLHQAVLVLDQFSVDETEGTAAWTINGLRRSLQQGR